MKSLLVVMLVAVPVMVGCNHKLQMTVNNTTTETRDVAIGVGGERLHRVGTVRAGGSLKHNVKIPKSELPAELRWACGGQRGAETITKDRKKLVINLERDAAVVTDGNAEIERRVETRAITGIRTSTIAE